MLSYMGCPALSAEIHCSTQPMPMQDRLHVMAISNFHVTIVGLDFIISHMKCDGPS